MTTQSTNLPREEFAVKSHSLEESKDIVQSLEQVGYKNPDMCYGNCRMGYYYVTNDRTFHCIAETTTKVPERLSSMKILTYQEFCRLKTKPEIYDEYAIF